MQSNLRIRLIWNCKASMCLKHDWSVSVIINRLQRARVSAKRIILFANGIREASQTRSAYDDNTTQHDLSMWRRETPLGKCPFCLVRRKYAGPHVCHEQTLLKIWECREGSAIRYEWLTSWLAGIGLLIYRDFGAFKWRRWPRWPDCQISR